jgi:hypothetical protein
VSIVIAVRFRKSYDSWERQKSTDFYATERMPADERVDCHNRTDTGNGCVRCLRSLNGTAAALADGQIRRPAHVCT